MMIANKFFARTVCAASLLTSAGLSLAVQNLDSHGQSKVNNALAKKWSTSETNQDGYKSQQGNSLVNVGSKKAGDCVVNVGTVQKGQKAPKDIVVTTKEVINICK